MSANNELTKDEILTCWRNFFTKQNASNPAHKQVNPITAAQALFDELQQERVESAKQAKLWGELLTPQFFNMATEKDAKDVKSSKEITNFDDKAAFIKKILAQSDIDLNHTDEQGKTSLDYALLAHNFPLALVLLEGGLRRTLNIHLPDKTGKNLFQYAIGMRHFNGIVILMTLVNVSEEDLKQIHSILSVVSSAGALVKDNVNFFDNSLQRHHIMLRLFVAKEQEEEQKKMVKWDKAKEEISKLVEELSKNVTDNIAIINKHDAGEVPAASNIFVKIASQYKGQYNACIAKVQEMKKVFANMLEISEALSKQTKTTLKMVGHVPPHLLLSCVMISFGKTHKENEAAIESFMSTFQPQVTKEVTNFFNAHRVARVATINKIKRLVNIFAGDYYEDVKRFCTKVGSRPAQIEFTLAACKSYSACILKQFDEQLDAFKRILHDGWEKNEELCATLVDVEAALEIENHFRKDNFSRIVEMYTAMGNPQSLFGLMFSCKQNLLDNEQATLNTKLHFIKAEIQRLIASKIAPQIMEEQLKQKFSDFELILAKDQETLKKIKRDIEQKKREARVIALKKARLEKEREEHVLLENKRLIQEKEAHCAKVIDGIKGLKQEIELLRQVLTKGDHNNMRDKDIDAIFGKEEQPKIPPFGIRESKKGVEITFNHNVIASFHRQHGKPIHERVFNDIRAKFEELDINLEIFEKVVASKNQIGNHTNVAAAAVAVGTVKP